MASVSSRARGYIRSTVTKMEADVKKAVDDKDRHFAKELIERLKLKLVRLSELNTLVLKEVEETEVNAEMASVAKYDDVIAQWIAVLDDVIGEDRTANLSQLSASMRSNGGRSVMRLPRFEMTKYNGDIEKWTSFWDTFSSAVDSREELSAVDKFSYLRSVLTGPALSCVEGLQITEASYDKAIERLKARFGRDDLVIDSIMSSFERLTTPKQDAVSLRKFFDDVECKILRLKLLKVNTDNCSGVLRPMIVRHLPQDLQLDWARHSRREAKTSLDGLIEFLREELELRESLHVRSENSKAQSSDLNKGERLPRASASTSALNVTVEDSGSKPRVKSCFICSSTNHFMMNCDVKTIKDRIIGLRKNKRCFNCLWYGHKSKECPRDKARCNNCKESHHPVLCPKIESKGNGEVKTTEVSMNHVNSEARNDVVYLKSAVVLVDGVKDLIKVRVLVDGGSQKSFISKRLAGKVNAVQTGSERLSIGVFGETTSKQDLQCKRFRVRLYDHTGNTSVLVDLCEVDSVCSSYSLLPSDKIRRAMNEQKLLMADPGGKTDLDPQAVDILIGGDYYWSIVTGEVKRLGERLTVLESVFGWLVHGSEEGRRNPLMETTSVAAMHISVDTVMTQEEDLKVLHSEVEQFWKLESLGISEVESKVPEVDKVEQHLRDTIVYTGERYKVKLPWNGRKDELKDNFNEAMKRFQVTARRLMKEPEKIRSYHQAMMNYLDDDHAEVVKNPKQVDGTLFYVPHQAVIREDHETMKLRVVFDASSGHPSLNDCLHVGPHLNPDVFELLLRFRQYEVAVTADMEKAFLQVEISEEDRDSARFLWLPKNWKYGDAITTVVYRMKRVLFGLNCGPFLLAATLKFHIETVETADLEVRKAINGNIYVDDLVKSVKTIVEGLQLYKEGRKFLREAGFNLRKWTTNSKELREAISSGEGKVDNKESYSDRLEKELVKVLGLNWSQWKDEFQFDVSEVILFLQDKPPTKRVVLRAMARIFDPLGFIGPFTVRLKCLFQSLWKMTKAWDEEMSDDLLVKWNKWKVELHLLDQIRIPRCILQPGDGEMTTRNIHVFCDASEVAYGAVVYLVEEIGDQRFSRLVASKNRVAPVKSVSIPRLELLGALISARLVYTIQQALGIEPIPVTFWSDSQAVLHWIKGDPERWKVFVANRVREVQRLTNPKDWKYVSTSVNPADRLTRGQSSSLLVNDDLWWKGPPWLIENGEFESFNSPPVINLDLEELEEKQSGTVLTISVQIAELWQPERFSSFRKLVRIVAWVQRFLDNCRSLESNQGELSAVELEKAEIVVIRYEQQRSYPEEYMALKAGERVEKNSTILRFDPQLDEEEVMRLGGRLHFSMMDYAVKHPIILNGDTRVVELVVQDCHNKVQHGGVQETLAELRERFWIPRGRTIVKRVLRKCLICARRRAKPLMVVEAPLPRNRVEPTFPFHVIGLDYAGPVFVRERKKEQKKTYILLITCAVTRAVHLELVPSMNIDDFLLAFRRFVARRGNCAIVYSDNAKTFKRATKDMEIWHKMVNSPEVKSFAAERQIKWNFIADRAPWWGGFWERLVRSVKEKLKVICGKALLKFEELRTILVEIEAVVNSRPLSYISDESHELITPAHFLIGRRFGSVPPALSAATKLGGKSDIGKRWKNRLMIVNRFWKAWRNDYLLSLRNAHERRFLGCVPELTKGELVLLDDEHTARHLWKTCRIDEVIKGRDGCTRSCIVLLPNGKKLRRPVQLLYPLEVETKEE